jgi:putative CRISPR-associated protein (TIGR02619 family)
MRAILSTIGASLFFRAGRPDEDVVQGLLATLEACSDQEASAETNSLSRILEDPQQDYIYFLHSDTVEGEACAEALRQYYDAQGYLAEKRRLAHLCYEASEFKVKGLNSLVNTLASLIEQHRDQGDLVLINATGGFKAQIAYATLLGLLYRVEVNYIHEDFNDIIQLPLLPVYYDLLMWQQYGEGLQRLLTTQDPDQAQTLRQQLPREFDMLIMEQDGTFVPTPAGNAFVRAFAHNYHRVQLQRHGAIKMSSDHKSVWGIRHMDHVNDIPDQDVRTLLRRLLSLSFVQQVILGQWDTRGAKEEAYLKLMDMKRGAVEYKLHCKAGEEQIMVVVQEGMENRLVEMIGHRAYP